MVGLQINMDYKNKFYQIFSLFGAFILGGLLCQFSKNPVKQMSTKFFLERQINKYKEVDCPSNSLTIAVFGQSNSANTINSKINKKLPANLFQYDWRSDKCYEYREPLLGATGKGGNIISYLAVKIINDKYPSKKILIVPFGIGSSSIYNWSYGNLSHLHNLVIKKLVNRAIYPDFFFWHQGESDSKMEDYSLSKLEKLPYFKSPNDFNNAKFSRYGTAKIDYYNALKTIYKRTIRNFPNSLFGVALVSRCIDQEPFENVRLAQISLANKTSNVFISADSDKVYGKKYRYDGCHFNKEGAILMSEYYFQSIESKLSN